MKPLSTLNTITLHHDEIHVDNYMNRRDLSYHSPERNVVVILEPPATTWSRHE